MLTLKRRRTRRVPPQRGRGEISGLFFCCAQCSILMVAVSMGLIALAGRSALALLISPLEVSAPGCANGEPRPAKAGSVFPQDG
jgi:hypothetical protein